MTIKGCDYAWSRPGLDLLWDNGYRFACRYLSYDRTGKNLSKAEADALRARGIAPVSNWEWDAHDALGGYQVGVRNATEANNQHLACGGPPDRPIYFSVDFDTRSANMATIRDYFWGINSVIGSSRTGVYGGYSTVDQLLAAGAVSWVWQTYAWSDGLWHPRAHIRQVRNGISLNGSDLDEDQAQMDDFGQWPTTTTPRPAPTWTEQLIMQLPTLARGATGLDVKRVQALTGAFGYTLAPDGVFGPLTDSAVRSFQGRHGLLVDGIVGQHTWTALLVG